MWEVVVENHVPYSKTVNGVFGTPKIIDQMSLQTQLKTQINWNCPLSLRHTLKHMLGKFRAANAAFPTEKLRQNRCCHPVRRQFGRAGNNAPLGLAQSAAARCHMAFEPVTMNIDDAG